MSAFDFLDPIADDGGVENVTRINYHRVQLGSGLMGTVGFIEAALNWFRNLGWLWIWAIVVVMAAPFFAIMARRALRSAPPKSGWLIDAFVAFCLLAAIAASAITGTGRHIPAGFAMVCLALAALLMMPPRRFAIIGAGTYMVFVLWVGALPIPFDFKIFPIVNNGLALVVACIARTNIDRIYQRSEAHRAKALERNDALRAANTALAQQNEERAELMVIAAHDLRSPLFGLANVLKLARTRPPESAGRLDELFEAAAESVDGMVALVSRLVDAHRLERRAAPILRRKDLGIFASRAIQRMAPLSEVAGIELELIPPAEPVWGWGEAASVNQMLDNLLSNAIRYSRAHGVVTVRVGAHADQPTIEIRDRGIGVPPTERAMLFKKFQRGSLPPCNGPRGSGLGLYIVDVLAKSIYAHCAYEPHPLGGSVFRIAFMPASAVNSRPPNQDATIAVSP